MSESGGQNGRAYPSEVRSRSPAGMTDRQFVEISLTAIAAVVVGSVLLVISGGRTAILGALLVPCIVVSYQNPRWGLLAFLIYLPFSATISYAIGDIFQAVGGYVKYTPDYPLFHLAKDAFYLSALLGMLANHRAWQKAAASLKPLSIALGILVGSCLLTLLFVNLPQQVAAREENPLLMGLVGLKVLIGYIPLILCGYYAVRDRQDLSFLSRLLVTLILICCCLNFLQYFFLLSGICPGNVDLPPPADTRASLQAHCLVGGSLLYNPGRDAIRLPGTFASPWQWAWFLISSTYITYATSLSDPSRLWRIVGWMGTSAVLGAAIVSGQRADFLLVPASLLVLVWFTQEGRGRISAKVKLASLLFLSILITSSLGIFQERVDSFIDRWTYSPISDFIVGQVRWLLDDRLAWLGQGLGRATSGARRLGSIRLIETYPVKIAYEVGVLGFLAFFGTLTTLTVLTFRAYRSLQAPSLRHWGLCLWGLILLVTGNPYYYPLAVDPVAVYYWFMAGLLLKLPQLDRQES